MPASNKKVLKHALGYHRPTAWGDLRPEDLASYYGDPSALTEQKKEAYTLVLQKTKGTLACRYPATAGLTLRFWRA